MERWYWIELIGFDNESDDYGVGAFLSRNLTTEGVSLLFSHIDFLFCESEELPATACSYFAHEYNRERRRQNWTRSQLIGLIETLHAEGVRVFLSCFDMTREITDTALLCYNRLGRPERLLNPIKPLDDGSTVGDIIISRFKAALDLYGFDGLQLADGLSSARLSIENGDFSLPLCRAFGKEIPKELMAEGEDAYIRRRAFILERARYEWTIFISDLWGDFYKKLFAVIHKPVMFNNAWTRNSFEALYRYGLDYKKCQPDRAFAVMIEDNSATRAITAARDEGGVELPLDQRRVFTYEYSLMEQDIKLATDGLKQITLTPISDTMEQWDAIRHCPTELSRSIVRRYNNFIYRGGRFERTCDAPHYCLSDGVPREDWEWLARQESYRIPTPTFIDGFTAVINPDGIYRELKRYIEKKSYPGSAILTSLLACGLNMGASVSLDQVAGYDRTGGLVVTDLASYTAEQKELLCSLTLPLLVIGEDVNLPKPASAVYRGAALSVALYGMSSPPDLSALASLDKEIAPTPISHGEIWTEPLFYTRVGESFFTELCRLMNESLGTDLCLTPEVKATSFLCGEERYILLSNDSYLYALPTVRTNAPITAATALLKDRGYTVKTKECEAELRIPPRSAEILLICR